MQVTIAGSGGWGTALAILLHENGHDVTLWSHFETESKQLAETHQNPYLPGVTLPEGLHYSADPACAQGREMVVFATPSFAVRTTARAFAPYLAETPLLVSVTKGIEEGTGYRMSELVSQETGRTVVALSGPSHAEEVSRGIPTGVVVACPERELAERVQNAFMCSRFRVYTSPDTAGIELGAALKNVIALCAGVCDGMGYGDNTKALLMTRGLAEVARLGMALGAHRETFAGLAGGLYACYIGVLNPSTFGFMKSIEILVMVVLGGMGSMLGSILSATVLTILPEATRSFDSYRMVIYSLVLILMMIFRPGGLLGSYDFSMSRLVERVLFGKKKKEGADHE